MSGRAHLPHENPAISVVPPELGPCRPAPVLGGVGEQGHPHTRWTAPPVTLCSALPCPVSYTLRLVLTLRCTVSAVRASLSPVAPAEPTDASLTAVSGEGKQGGLTGAPNTFIPIVPPYRAGTCFLKIHPACLVMELTKYLPEPPGSS